MRFFSSLNFSGFDLNILRTRQSCLTPFFCSGGSKVEKNIRSTKTEKTRHAWVRSEHIQVKTKANLNLEKNAVRLDYRVPFKSK